MVPVLLDWFDAWSGVATMAILMSTIMLIALVAGIVLIVKYVAGRNAGASRQCTACGTVVRPGNVKCPACGAQMNWT